MRSLLFLLFPALAMAATPGPGVLRVQSDSVGKTHVADSALVASSANSLLDLAHNYYVDSLPAGVATDMFSMAKTTGADSIGAMTSQTRWIIDYAGKCPAGSTTWALALSVGSTTLFTASLTGDHFIRHLEFYPRPETNKIYLIRSVSTAGTYTSTIDSVAFSDWSNPHAIHLTVQPTLAAKLVGFQARAQSALSPSGSSSVSLPIASSSLLGAVKISAGSGLAVDANGQIALDRTYRVISKTRDTAQISDVVIGLSGSAADTVQLLSTTVGRIIRFKRIDNNTSQHVILGTIDGSSNYVFTWPYEAIELMAITSSTFAIIGVR